MTTIGLKRAMTPEELKEEECALCALSFRVESVFIEAHGVRDQWGDVATICPTCLEYLNQRNPERFPSVQEYEEALRRYPAPMWATQEDADRALNVEDFFVVLNAENWIIRA